MFLQAIVAWDKQIYRLYHQHYPPRPAGKHLTGPLWYLRHGRWRWPLMPLLLKVEIELFHIYVAKVATATSYVHHFAKSASYVYPSMCILIFLKGKSFANDPMVLIVIYYNTIDRVPKDFWSFETILPPMIPWYWLLFTTIPSIECLKTSGVVHFASCTLPPMISWY